MGIEEGMSTAGAAGNEEETAKFVLGQEGVVSTEDSRKVVEEGNKNEAYLQQQAEQMIASLGGDPDSAIEEARANGNHALAQKIEVMMNRDALSTDSEIDAINAESLTPNISEEQESVDPEILSTETIEEVKEFTAPEVGTPEDKDAVLAEKLLTKIEQGDSDTIH